MSDKDLFGDAEYFRYFYSPEQTQEATAYAAETGWNQIWGSDAQGLNGDTWIVYRDITDLPRFLREYAAGQEKGWQWQNKLSRDKEMLTLAEDIDRFAYDYDPYAYQDAVDIREDSVEQLFTDILYRDIEYLNEWLLNVAKENEGEEFIKALRLIDRLLRVQKLTAESVTDLKMKSHEYLAGDRKHVYTFDCKVKGIPEILTYRTGVREHFISPLYDRGELEDTFSIHTDVVDIWDMMPAAELEKLSNCLSGEAEAFFLKKELDEADSVEVVMDVYEMIMETQLTMTHEQLQSVWDAMEAKAVALIEYSLEEAKDEKQLRHICDSLDYASNVIGEEQWNNLRNMIEEKKQIIPAASISFYVAECMEFPSLGEYHDGLTLDEALELYKQIPPERMCAVKGIGFKLKDGSIYDGMPFSLMSGGKVNTGGIDDIPHYRDSPLVREAVTNLYMSDYLKKTSVKEKTEVKKTSAHRRR